MLFRSDLVSGTIALVRSGTATMVNCGNGWYLCSVTGTSSLATVGLDVGPVLAGGTNNSYTGDGTGYIQDAGGNFEVGASPTSEIPTGSSQVTRALDVATLNNLAPWYNPVEGTLFARATNLVGTGTAIAQLGLASTDRIFVTAGPPGVAGTGGIATVGGCS